MYDKVVFLVSEVCLHLNFSFSLHMLTSVLYFSGEEGMGGSRATGQKPSQSRQTDLDPGKHINILDSH